MTEQLHVALWPGYVVAFGDFSCASSLSSSDNKSYYFDTYRLVGGQSSSG